MLKNKNILNLTNTTFIIPIMIESEDRLKNFNSVIGFLNKHFNTNVIIHELFENEPKVTNLIFNNLNIKYLNCKLNNNNYHRTKQLNEMLNLVQTDVVCNYDIDVVLPISTYIIAEKLLENDIYDVIYPYGFGNYLKKISNGFDRIDFDQNFKISKIPESYIELDRAEYGHCIFFRTDSYKRIGGENENFISYGPEDFERYKRCFRFKMRVFRLKDFVYHFEHERTENSSIKNKDFEHNSILFKKLCNLDDKDFLNYYKKIDYLKKYNFVVKVINHKENDLYLVDESVQNKDFIIDNDSTIDNNENIIDNLIDDNKVIEVHKQAINPFEIVFQPYNNNCVCGQPIDRISYNYCPKCNKIY